MKTQRVKNHEKGKMLKMEEGMITNVPLDVTINILSRLPIRTIISCKCVCKSWRDSIECQDFAKSHLSKSVPCLAVFQKQVSDKKQFNVFKLADCFEAQTSRSCFNRSFNFKFPHPVSLHSSVDGLLLLNDICGRFYVCNPVNREYIKLPFPPYRSCPETDLIGLGVSKITGHYKIVRVNSPKCEVYTLGTGSWRNVAADTTISYIMDEKGVFLNGNFYWLAVDLKDKTLWKISCFDFETEHFSTFFLPSLKWNSSLPSLTTLADRLCLCDNLAYTKRSNKLIVALEIVIWSMKEYNDDKFWTKDFAIIEELPQVIPFPIKIVKVFEDGDILMAHKYGPELLRCSIKTKAVRRIDLPGLYVNYFTTSVVYTPSFIPVLKTLVMEDVRSFSF